jgi:putative SOS response-associated peptidase YedK
MCGRFVLSTPGQALAAQFSQLSVAAAPATVDRFNVAPSQDIPALRRNQESGEAEWAELQWGLIPSWAKDPAIGARMINARSETVAEKPSFRTPFRRRRCIVPMTGFYEWKRSGSKKQPFYFRSSGPGVLAVAGLWEHWDSAGGEFVETVAMLTTSANELMSPIHHRMPVLLDADGCKRWLDCKTEREPVLSDLFEPRPSTDLQVHPVGLGVNNARNNDPANITPQEIPPPDEPRQTQLL